MNHTKNIIGLIAYSLTVFGYMTRLLKLDATIYTLFGALLLITGYMILAFTTLKHMSTETEKEEEKTKQLQKIGYSILALFFVAIYLFPALTYTVRTYDIFAAFGYVATLFMHSSIPYILLVAYYALGSHKKLEEFKESNMNKLQFISRTLLVLYYTMSALHV